MRAATKFGFSAVASIVALFLLIVLCVDSTPAKAAECDNPTFSHEQAAICQLVLQGLTANLGGFVSTLTMEKTPSTTSTAYQLTGTGTSVVVDNTKGTADLLVNFGTVSVVATLGTSPTRIIPAGQIRGMDSGGAGYIAIKSATSTASVEIQQGTGLFAGAGAGSSSSGGGAVTIASGADIVEGTTGDTRTAGTVLGFLESLESIFHANAPSTSALQTSGNTSATATAAELGTTADAAGCATNTLSSCVKQLDADVKGTGNIQGVVAAGATQTDNPLADGCLAKTATPTAVTDGQKVNSLCDISGRSVVVLGSIGGLKTSGLTAAMTGTTSTAVTGMAAPGSGLRNWITSIMCGNSHATVGTFVDLQDGSAGTVFWTVPAAAVYGGAAITGLDLPQPTQNNALFVVDETTGANVKCSFTGYKAP